MRLVLGCLLMLLAPSVAIVGWTEFQNWRDTQRTAEQCPPTTQQSEVLFFNASWCGPCRRMKPIVSDLKRQGYPLRDIDVDKNKSLAQKYGVRGIPTFVLVENGREVRRFSGGTSADNLRKFCGTQPSR